MINVAKYTDGYGSLDNMVDENDCTEFWGEKCMARQHSEEIKCMWLNKSFGKDSWICNAKFKPTHIYECKKCQEDEE